jgi:hypothetical protein
MEDKMNIIKSGKILGLAFLLAMGIALTGCDLLGGDDDENEKPTVTGVTVSDDLADVIVVDAGAEYDLDGVVTDDAGITGITIVLTDAGGAVGDIAAVTGFSGQTTWDLGDASQTLVVPADFITGTATLVITATDADGETGSQTVNLTVVGSTSLVEYTGGVMHHLLGVETGAYDLVNNTPLSSADAAGDKDLLDITTVGTSVSEWTSGNGSMFVKDNTFDYANATDASAGAAFLAGTSSTTIGSFAVGDLIIVDLSGSGEYAVVKITAIDLTYGASTNGNLGKISFVYKF